MSAAEVAQRHQARQAAAAAAVAAGGANLWGEVDPDALSASWAQLLPRLMLVLTAAQRTSAASADSYTDSVLAELGVDVDPEGRIRPEAFAGESSNGAPLATVLTAPVVTAKQYVGQGADVDQALRSGGAQLDMILRTEVADAGRTAGGAAIVARPTVGYVRQVTPPSCPRCVILAGKFYRYNRGFLRHPRCFPAGVVVSGPAYEASTRRWFQGELVILTTASGQQLTLTGNHPVLTRCGWVPANLLNEGDDVVRSTRPQGASALVVPDHHEVPSLVEDVWRSFSVRGLDRVPSTAEDFHGDGNSGQVDVVHADGALGRRADAAFGQHLAQGNFTSAVRASGEFDAERMAMLVDLRRAAHASGAIGSRSLSLPFRSGHLASADVSGLARAAALDTCLDEAFADSPTAYAVLPTEREFAGASFVGSDDIVDRKISDPPRWNAPGDSFSVESRAGYASRGVDLLNRLSGQVELDRVVELRRVEWSGHVYSLKSAEGWHSANSLIVSNCDCYHIPAPESVAGDLTTDPRQLFEQGQIRGLSKADTQAIRDGADISQVVNAHRGMYTAGGRKFTTEGTTRRGVASRSRRLFGQDAPLETTDRSGRRTVRRITRPRPEQIYRDATSRQDAIRLLKLYGYLG